MLSFRLSSKAHLTTNERPHAITHTYTHRQPGEGQGVGGVKLMSDVTEQTERGAGTETFEHAENANIPNSFS